MERRGLVDTETLAGWLRGEVLPVVIDLRQDPADGRPVIPGAVHARLHDGFAQHRADRNLHYDLPTAAEFASAMQRAGVTPGTDLVLTDDMRNRWATRVYWLLRYFRHRGSVAVLDGGNVAWMAAGGPTAELFRVPPTGSYPVPGAVDESIRATAAEVASGLESGVVTMCDVRTAEEYIGSDVRAARGGHIPGAVNVAWDDCLGPDGRFLPDDRLAAVLAPFLDGLGTPVTYCQGGIRASLTWFALHELLGRPARMYAGSWEEWAQDPALPVEVAN